MMSLFEVLPATDGYTTARNLATTHDLFSFLFESPAPASPVVHGLSYSTDPFSSATAVTASLFAMLALLLTV